MDHTMIHTTTATRIRNTMGRGITTRDMSITAKNMTKNVEDVVDTIDAAAVFCELKLEWL